jgi:hypothetical protein
MNRSSEDAERSGSGEGEGEAERVLGAGGKRLGSFGSVVGCVMNSRSSGPRFVSTDCTIAGGKRVDSDRFVVGCVMNSRSSGPGLGSTDCTGAGGSTIAGGQRTDCG